jgi:hypothetical protein
LCASKKRDRTIHAVDFAVSYREVYMAALANCLGVVHLLSDFNTWSPGGLIVRLYLVAYLHKIKVAFSGIHVLVLLRD